MSQPRVAVVGHVEWVQFARVSHIPRAGEIVHASEPFAEPAGGGAVAAVQLARLAGASLLMTALGDDEHGRSSQTRLQQLGVDVHAATLAQPTRRAVTLVDDARERTITTFGARLQPSGGDRQIGWDALGRVDAIYFTAGDLDALRIARAAARVLVASPRALDALGHEVRIDALVLSADDEVERSELHRARDEADVVVLTEGARGGSYRRADGERGSWAAAPLPGEPVDSYGCGDSFAAGLTYGLGAGLALDDALALAARCGAFCLTGRGPYGRQLSRADLCGDGLLEQLIKDRSPG
ncbi:MAG TPA: PfkB family carbohydrate kinase [Solirubrobacteraceae bacterium]|nr:PfkB family carbohydrate kinase [Solirubrobacteraceae bacterium]